MYWQATISDPEERKAAMAALLQNETKALQNMQALKMTAQREIHAEKTQQMLERMAQPHQWQVRTDYLPIQSRSIDTL